MRQRRRQLSFLHCRCRACAQADPASKLITRSAPPSALPPALPVLQLVLRLNSHDYPQLAASMVVPVLASLWQKLFSRDEQF